MEKLAWTYKLWRRSYLVTVPRRELSWRHHCQLYRSRYWVWQYHSSSINRDIAVESEVFSTLPSAILELRKFLCAAFRYLLRQCTRELSSAVASNRLPLFRNWDTHLSVLIYTYCTVLVCEPECPSSIRTVFTSRKIARIYGPSRVGVQRSSSIPISFSFYLWKWDGVNV